MEFTPLLTGGLVVLALAGGFVLRIWVAKRSKHSLEQTIKAELESARSEAKEVVLEAKNKAASIVDEAQKEERDRKQELRRVEERLVKKEDSLDVDRRAIEVEEKHIKEELARVVTLEADVKGAHEKIIKEMERVGQLTREEARTAITKEFEDAHRDELAKMIGRLEREKYDEIQKKSVDIMTTAIQRYSRECVNDVTTSVVPLPNEEIKGKIIGREGRNIRAFERLTGVEVIVDDSPENLIISSFDPFRRELAKIALEKLLKDGRIQPAKIEEKVEEAHRELDERVRKIGEEAAFEVGVLDIPKEIIPVLGRLNFRTSYGQNVLQHSIEMAHIASMIATDLGLNVMVTKKAALLHDIGKAMSHEIEGTHVEIGRKLLKKYNVDEAVIRAMESHHEEFPFSSPESYVVTAADAISAGRPGARRDTLEKYIKRLEDIEKVVKTFDGVKQAYAISAGREVRVFVVPEKIDDFGAFQIAKQIASKIKSDVQFPGEIKVTVLREVRAVEYAR
ncbi:MAG: ribonuclease Y [Candidatus Jorgensenbacteria bacterium]|nr:ribonuclease Y [Candidatus Jorgensenbacteria bacterium]